MVACKHASSLAWKKTFVVWWLWMLLEVLPTWHHAVRCLRGTSLLVSLIIVNIDIVHRDVAARNVLLSSEMRGRLADFGMSRESAADSAYYTSRGGAVPVRYVLPCRAFDITTMGD